MKKNLLRAAAALAGLIIGIAIFFPWDALGSSLFAFAAKEAASRGVYVTASSSEVSGLFKKNFSYKGVNADLPVARASLRETFVAALGRKERAADLRPRQPRACDAPADRVELWQRLRAHDGEYNHSRRHILHRADFDFRLGRDFTLRDAASARAAARQSAAGARPYVRNAAHDEHAAAQEGKRGRMEDRAMKKPRFAEKLSAALTIEGETE